MTFEKFENDMKRRLETTVRIERDAKIIESAIRIHADYFLTYDKRHILSKKNEIEREFGIRIKELDEFLKEFCYLHKKEQLQYYGC